VTSMASRRTPQIAAALVLYLASAVYLTWPLVTDLGSSTYLFPSNFARGGGDLTGSIAHLRELVDGNHNPFGSGRIGDFNAPDGLEIRWALNFATFPSVILLYALAFAMGSTVAMNLFVLLGYVASGFAMFLFVRRLTGHAWISLLAGWSFAFYPFAVVTSEHPAFVHGWPFVLVAWRVLQVWEKPTLRNGLWAGGAAILAAAWTPHYVVIGGVTYAALTAAALLGAAFGPAFRRHLMAHALGGGLALAFVLLMTAIVSLSYSGETLPASSLTDVAETSARPLMFLVPSPDTLLGEHTRSFLDGRGWIGVERTLYVGWSILLLALLAVAASFAHRLDGARFRAAALAVAMAVTAVLFSAPPEATILGATIKFPAWFVYEVTPGVRLLSRFVIPLMAALSVLASLGLLAIVRSVSARMGVAVLAVATLLIPLDLWNRFPNRVYRYETPSVYRSVPSHPSAALAEYPVRPITAVGDYLDLYYQDAHGLPILNGYFRGPSERRALALAGLDEPTTPGALATLGVRYVLLTPFRAGPGVPDAGTPGAGFRRLAGDGYGTLFRVTAPPSPFAFQRDGFWGPEGEGAARYQWAGEGTVRLEVIAPCKTCSGRLEFTTASFARPRVITLLDENGDELDVVPVGTSPQLVSVPLEFDGRTLIELKITPGPQAITDATGSGDPRRVSVFVQSPRFVLR
jgi:hypothetical protein